MLHQIVSVILSLLFGLLALIVVFAFNMTTQGGPMKIEAETWYVLGPVLFFFALSLFYVYKSFF